MMADLFDIAESDLTDRLRRITEMESAGKFSTLPGCFPSPPAVIARLLGHAPIEPGHWVLERSAGKGDLADEIVRRTPRSEWCFDVLESNHTL